jgi:hypothetical protein
MSMPDDNEGLRLHVDGVQAGYGPVTIIRDMTLRLQSGTITALLGAEWCREIDNVQGDSGIDSCDRRSDPAKWRSISPLGLVGGEHSTAFSWLRRVEVFSRRCPSTTI